MSPSLYDMKIIIIYCLFTVSHGLPFWGAEKFNKTSPNTQKEYCAFLYNVTVSNLPAKIRQMAFRTMDLKKCYRKISQHQRKILPLTYRTISQRKVSLRKRSLTNNLLTITKPN